MKLDERTIKLLAVIAIGVGLTQLVNISDIKSYPEIWSTTYVTVLDIAAKITGSLLSLAAGYLLIFTESKKADDSDYPVTTA